MFTILLSIVVILLICFLVILVNSPGKLTALKDAQGEVIEGSISEKVWVDIGGIKQGMFIRGENPKNPVILYLHGGPGTPMLQFIEYLEGSERIEEYFTVCYWDQRGSGMTYGNSKDPSKITLNTMVEDTREVTEYLKKRFAQDKIYLAGHSWGSYLGVKTVEKYPDNYLAYIGIGQVTNQTESERLSYDYMLNHATEINDRDTVSKLGNFDPYGDGFPSLEYLIKVRTSTLNKYKVGHLHQGLSFADIPKALFLFKGYTIGEKINWFLGADMSMIRLFPVILKDSLFETSYRFKIPVYLIHGAHDHIVSEVLAEKYFNVLEAPKKEFFLFENSAHSPNMEEPEKFIEIFRKIAAENKG